jgi:hypothetical protein
VLSALAEQSLHGLIVRLAAHDHLPISPSAISPAKDARGLTGVASAAKLLLAGPWMHPTVPRNDRVAQPHCPSPYSAQPKSHRPTPPPRPARRPHPGQTSAPPGDHTQARPPRPARRPRPGRSARTPPTRAPKTT